MKRFSFSALLRLIAGVVLLAARVPLQAQAGSDYKVLPEDIIVVEVFGANTNASTASPRAA